MLAERVDVLLDEVVRSGGSTGTRPSPPSDRRHGPARAADRGGVPGRHDDPGLGRRRRAGGHRVFAVVDRRGRPSRRGDRRRSTAAMESEDAEVFVVRITERAGPRVRPAGGRRGRVRAPALPVLRQADRPGGAHLSACQRLPQRTCRNERSGPARPGASSSCTAGSWPRRTPRFQGSVTLDGETATVRLQAGRGGAAAVGLPRRHAGRARGRGVRRLRGARLVGRAADAAARRAVRRRAWCSCGSTRPSSSRASRAGRRRPARAGAGRLARACSTPRTGGAAR